MTERHAWLVALALASTLPLIVSGYAMHLLVMALIASIAVLGLNFTFGWAGQISMAQGAFVGIGAYTTAILTTRYGLPIWASAPAAVVIATSLAGLIGLPILRLKGHYLALATLGLNVTLIIVASGWRDVLGGTDGIGRIPRPTIGNLLETERQYFYLALAVLAAAVAIALRLRDSHLGRAMVAVRDDEIAASASSINASKVKLQSFMLGAAYAGAAGVLMAHFTSYIAPEDFNLAHSILYLAMLIIGGEGSIVGAVLGAVLLTFLPEWLRFLGPGYLAFYGALMVLVLIFIPKGLAGLLGAQVGRFRMSVR